MLEVELGLLSDGSIGVERRLDAVPQYGHVHGRGGRAGRGCCLLDDIMCRRALAVGAVWAAGGVQASSLLPEGPRLGARRIRAKDEEAPGRQSGGFWCTPCALRPACAGVEGLIVWVAANVPGHTWLVPSHEHFLIDYRLHLDHAPCTLLPRRNPRITTACAPDRDTRDMCSLHHVVYPATALPVLAAGGTGRICTCLRPDRCLA
jgi:hypothetical protein